MDNEKDSKSDIKLPKLEEFGQLIYSICGDKSRESYFVSRDLLRELLKKEPEIFEIEKVQDVIMRWRRGERKYSLEESTKKILDIFEKFGYSKPSKKFNFFI